MPDPTVVVPANAATQTRRTAITPVRVVRVLTQSLGVPDLAAGDGVISGVASVAGVPTAGVIVSLITDPGNVTAKQTVSGVGGNFSFINLPPGRYQVLFYDPTTGYRSKVVHTELV